MVNKLLKNNYKVLYKFLHNLLITGFAGKTIKINRISGLDPAGIIFLVLN